MNESASNVLADGWLVWEVPGKPVSVQLGPDVVGRLGMAVREGFKALPRRGLETGGLLLGTKREAGGRVVVTVEDFEPVESEHATGPSYLLSDADRRLLEARIAANKAPANNTSIVGFYRSHTRRDFAITVEDAFLFSSYFRKASDVFLIIKSNDGGALTAGFIIRERGKVLSYSPYVQFPLERAIAIPAAQVARVPELQASQASPQNAQIVHPAASQRTVWTGRRPIWLATAGALALTVALLFAIRWGISSSIRAESGLPLALNVTNTGNGLRLSWNHRAARQASHAVLWIKDGQDEQRFDLDARQLGEGSVAYWPRNSDVSFRLELLSPGATVAESVRAIGGPSKAPIAVPGPAAVVEPPTRPAVEASAVAVVNESPAPVSSLKPPQHKQIGTASRLLSRAFAIPPPESNPGTVAPAILPDPPTIQPMVALPPEHSSELLQLIEPANSQRSPDSVISSLRVSVEPSSRSGHSARNIPLIGKHYGRSDYVPPVPLRNPALPNSPPRNVARDVNIDVKVYVNPSGKVDYSEVLSNVAEADRDLAVLAMFTGRRWEFVPAHTRDGTVPGEVILHYQFGSGVRVSGDQALTGR